MCHTFYSTLKVEVGNFFGGTIILSNYLINKNIRIVVVYFLSELERDGFFCIFTRKVVFLLIVLKIIFYYLKISQ